MNPSKLIRMEHLPHMTPEDFSVWHAASVVVNGERWGPHWIYENDIPPKIKMKTHPPKIVKSVRKFGRDRWKPDGITDNREEFYQKYYTYFYNRMNSISYH